LKIFVFNISYFVFGAWSWLLTSI